MTNARFTNALSRLEAAAARLEAAVGALPPLSTDPGFAELEARHRKLRAGTAEALARLDRLIATHADVKG